MSDLTDAQFRLGPSGYYNNGAVSPSNPGGFANDGHETNLFAVARDIVVVGAGASDAATLAGAKADAAAASALSAFNAPGTRATSSSTKTIPAALGGSMTYRLDQAGKAFAVGQSILFAITADAIHSVGGPITAFDEANKDITFAVQFIGGTGTPSASAWTASPLPPVDSSLTGRVAALEAANIKQKARALLLFKEIL